MLRKPEGPNWRPERGREWEPIKILLEEDGSSNKMNTANPKHVSDSTTQVGQDRVGTRVLLVLGTNTHRTLLKNAAEQAT
jgi:hypothetical protein